MATMPDLVLRDIHQPPAPSWWPPAVGWWWLVAAFLLLVCAVVGWRLFRTWQRRRWQRLFDTEVAAAPDAAGQIAAISSLLRRAARRHRPDADRLQGDDWLSFLDTGVPGAPFTTGEGVALRDGAFRRDADTLDTTALHALARARFIALMLGRRR